MALISLLILPDNSDGEKMKVDKVYNFFFHPFSEDHSKKVKTLSALTVIALSLITGGVFLVAFGAMQWRDRKIKVLEPKTQKIHPIAVQTIGIQKMDQVPPNSDMEKLKRVKSKNAEQVRLFENWAEDGDWKKFELSHYDWWAFPVDRSSAGYGDQYAVYAPDIEVLKADEEFIQNLRKCATLVVKSWGWDLEKDRLISESERFPSQQWTGYGVRLGKMANSLKLFGQEDVYESLQHFFDKVCLPQTEKYPLEDWVSKSLGR